MVLENKLGLSSSAAPYEAEERLTKARAAEIFANDLLVAKAPGTFDTLAFIHRQLFQDVYDFAGAVRTQDYLLAMERSPIKDTEIKALLRAALTDKVDDRETFMKGIDAIYAYEGYETYRTGEL